MWIGAAALTAFAAKTSVVDPSIDVYKKVTSIGQDYSNDLFYSEVGDRPVDRARLRELLADDHETALSLHSLDPEVHTNRDSLAEFSFETNVDGPVYAAFSGLRGDGISLTILNVSVDNGEQFLVPLVRSPDTQPPMQIQLGTQGPGRHLLSAKIQYATRTVAPEEIQAQLTQGKPDTIGSFLALQQPDIYLRDYSQLANNFPRASYVFVRETDTSISAVYWQECFDEDREYGLIGTTLERLVDTKNRPTDFDWDMEKLFDKRTGALQKATIATPYHLRQEIPVSPDDPSHTPLRIASLNNNVQLVNDPRLLLLPKVRLRPTPIAEEDRIAILHATDPSAARYSLCENYAEGTLDPNDPTDAAILEKFDLDVRDCQN